MSQNSEEAACGLCNSCYAFAASKQAELEYTQMRDMSVATYIEPAEADTRSTAIRLMTQALELIDRDASISGVAGAHLQMAIDSLGRNMSPDPASTELH